MEHEALRSRWRRWVSNRRLRYAKRGCPAGAERKGHLLQSCRYSARQRGAGGDSAMLGRERETALFTDGLLSDSEANKWILWPSCRYSALSGSCTLSMPSGGELRAGPDAGQRADERKLRLGSEGTVLPVQLLAISRPCVRAGASEGAYQVQGRAPGFGDQTETRREQTRGSRS
jgi:hypothetical protein